MILNFSCPSKTFLLGEYLVLNNGSALLMTAAPRFELKIQTRGQGQVHGIHADSPAGNWIRQNRLVFEKVNVDFIDPYKGLGGFGASSAQYLLTHIANQVLKNPDKHDDFNIEQIWRAYRQMEMVSDEGLRPSGADVVAQFMGGFSEVHMEPFSGRAFAWPMADYEVILAHTGNKMPTHEHLRGLKRVNTDELEWIYARAIETLEVGDAPAFFDSVNDYYAELLELGLVAESTQVAVTSLLNKPFIQAAKGCGAMGSDVVAVFVSKENAVRAKALLKELGLRYVSDTTQVAKGFLLTEEDEASDTAGLPGPERLS